MSYIVRNKTVIIGNISPMQVNDETFFIHILEGRDSMRPLILRSVPKVAWIFCGIAWIFIFIASFFRYILYSYLCRKYREKQLTSIDVLILVHSIIQHLANISRILFFTLLLLEDASTEYWDWKMDSTGKVFCVLFKITVAFEHYYSCIGSLGIAIFRMMYIQFDMLIKDIIGTTNLLKIILYGGLGLTGVFVSALFASDYEHLLMEHCHMPPNLFLLRMLDEYEQGKGGPSIYKYFIYPRIAIGGIMLFMTMTELVIYIIFFRFIYLHDNNEKLRALLEPQVIRKRNKTNAITFFGQFCSFLFEVSIWILFTLAMMVGKESVLLLAVFSILRTISFTCMTIIEIVTSSSLRSIMCEKLF